MWRLKTLQMNIHNGIGMEQIKIIPLVDLKLDFEETEPKINDFAENNAKIYSSLFLPSHTSDKNLSNIK